MLHPFCAAAAKQTARVIFCWGF